MTVRRVDFEDPWPVDPDNRVRWCEWMSGYGVDPNFVCIPGWVEADDERRQIRVEVYARNEDGKLIVDVDVVDHGRREVCRQVRREVLVVQLEAPALPFPEVL